MTQILLTRRARRPYTCECTVTTGPHEIQRGDTYLRIALTPNDSDVCNTGWRTARYCRPCGEATYRWWVA